MCENCEARRKDAAPELCLFEKAQAWTRNQPPEEIFSDALVIWSDSTCVENQNNFIMAMQAEGESPWVAVSRYAALMMRVGFAVGVQIANEYPNTVSADFPAMTVSDEDVQEFIANQERLAQESMAPARILEALKETLAGLGLDPEQFDVVNLSDLDRTEIPESASGGDDEPRPGLYL